MTPQEFADLDLSVQFSTIKIAECISKKEELNRTILIYCWNGVFFQVYQHKPFYYFYDLKVLDEVEVETYLPLMIRSQMETKT
jgi:hypothetical protein